MMKIYQLIAHGFIFLIPFLSYSQSESLSKFPVKKDLMIELDFNPFGNDGVFGFNRLQSKYWINNKTAIRFGVQFDYKNNSITEEDYPIETVNKSTLTEKSNLLGANPGIQFRILPNARISPYWGFEFSYINKSSHSEYVDYNKYYDPSINNFSDNKSKTTIENAWREVASGYYTLPNGFYYFINKTYGKERSYNSYGLNLLFGTDIFVLKYLYLGFEMGIGYKAIKYKDMKIYFDDYGNTNPMGITYNDVISPSAKTSNFGFYYNKSIRIGVYF